MLLSRAIRYDHHVTVVFFSVMGWMPFRDIPG